MSKSNDQKSKFYAEEADRWFRRNESAIGSMEAASDDIIQALASVSLSPQTILEIGCSNGYRLDWLSDYYPGTELWGIDPSESAISDGKNKSPELNLQVGSAESLPFEDESIDTLIFGFCLCWCDRKDLFSIASEADRVLSEDGLIVIKDFFPPFAFKNPYVHSDDCFSYKMDYSSMFLWNPAYSCLYQSLTTHNGKKVVMDADSRLSVSVLQKRSTDAYVESPFS